MDKRIAMENEMALAIRKLMEDAYREDRGLKIKLGKMRKANKALTQK